MSEIGEAPSGPEIKDIKPIKNITIPGDKVNEIITQWGYQGPDGQDVNFFTSTTSSILNEIVCQTLLQALQFFSSKHQDLYKKGSLYLYW